MTTAQIRRNGASGFNHIEQAQRYISWLWQASVDRDVYYNNIRKLKAEGEQVEDFDDVQSCTDALNAILQSLELAKQGMLAVAEEWWNMDRDDLLKKVG